MDESGTPFVRLCGTQSVLVGGGLYLGHILYSHACWQIVANLLPHLSDCGVALVSGCHIFFVCVPHLRFIRFHNSENVAILFSPIVANLLDCMQLWQLHEFVRRNFLFAFYIRGLYF